MILFWSVFSVSDQSSCEKLELEGTRNPSPRFDSQSGANVVTNWTPPSRNAETSSNESDRRARRGVMDYVIVHKEGGTYSKIDSSNISSAFHPSIWKNMNAIRFPLTSQSRKSKSYFDISKVSYCKLSVPYGRKVRWSKTVST